MDDGPDELLLELEILRSTRDGMDPCDDSLSPSKVAPEVAKSGAGGSVEGPSVGGVRAAGCSALANSTAMQEGQ